MCAKEPEDQDIRLDGAVLLCYLHHIQINLNHAPSQFSSSCLHA